MNVLAGLVTVYLVITSLLTVRRRPRNRAGWIARRDAGGVRARAGEPRRGRRQCRQGTRRLCFPLLMFGALALSAGVGDRRMMRAGGLRGAAQSSGTCGACASRCAIAAGAFFLGPARRIPEPIRIPALRLIPLVVLVTMVYWLWRYRRKRIPRGAVGVTAPEAI